MKLVRAFKHLFIPHHGNDFKPHFFRELSVALILFASMFLLGASFGSSFFIHRTVLGVSVAADVLVDLTNDSRLAYNESPLIRNQKLDRAAELKGKDMVSQGYFAHESPAGVTPWHWFQEVGYTFLYAGENLAVNFTDNQDVQNAWLASPLHRANILNVKFQEIGLATVQGIYKNNPTIFVVQEFGTPAIQVAPKVEAQTAVATTSVSDPKVVEAKPAPVEKKNGAVGGELALATGEVRGEEIATTTPVATSTYQPIVTTNELAIVKNTDNVEPTQTVIIPPAVEKYSTWYGRLLFGGSRYVDMIYRILILIIAFALVTMVLVEVRRQHWKHIMYGLLMLAVLTVMVFINQTFF